MKKQVTIFMFIACLIMTACSNDDEPIVIDNIVGTWHVQYPAGLQTEDLSNGLLTRMENFPFAIMMCLPETIPPSMSIQFLKRTDP